jgi:exosortase A-associated hydrolase 1
MRRLLTIRCEGDMLGASHDSADGTIGIVMVTGGTQTRIGSHRMYEGLAASLARSGYPCLRFDRRGVGDSEGKDPGWRGSGPDLKAAVADFRRGSRALERVIGIGLCDGASALALHGAEAGLQGAVLINPWLVESGSDAPPPAAIRHHYRQRLASVEGWKKLLGGSVSYGKLLKGVGKSFTSAPTDLADEVAASLERNAMPTALILCAGDATAIAASQIWSSKRFEKIRKASAAPYTVESDSHTFARPGDAEALQQACLTAIAALSRRR